MWLIGLPIGNLRRNCNSSPKWVAFLHPKLSFWKVQAFGTSLQWNAVKLAYLQQISTLKVVIKHRKIAKSCPEHISSVVEVWSCFFYNYYRHYCHYYYYHNLSFWVLSQFDFLRFVTVWVFEFCHSLIVFVPSWFFLKVFHSLSFWVLSPIEFCHILTFWVWSQFEFWVLYQFEFLSFVIIWVFEFCHNLSFGLLSQFKVLSFVTIWFFEFCNNLRVWVLSQFELWSIVTT